MARPLKRTIKTTTYFDKHNGVTVAVPACPSCGGPMLDDSWISGMCCQDCYREISYMVKKN